MKMRALRTEERYFDVVLGPCPGCEMWQLDYADAVASQFGSIAAFRRAVEDILQEHLAECPHLQDLLESDL